MGTKKSPQLELKSYASKERAKINQRFFKTGKGQYSYGDIFIGVRAPHIRKVAQNHVDLSQKNLRPLIQSSIHEERMLGLLILVNQYNLSKNQKEKQKHFSYYTRNFKYINNWDLVDATAPQLAGQHLFENNRSPLFRWAQSDHLWTKRISIVSTLWFIRKGELKETYKISKMLLNDNHDLIHKAVGWMLRESAKRDQEKTESFLKTNYENLPRTTLRYAIERLPEQKRKKFLRGEF